MQGSWMFSNSGFSATFSPKYNTQGCSSKIANQILSFDTIPLFLLTRGHRSGAGGRSLHPAACLPLLWSLPRSWFGVSGSFFFDPAATELFPVPPFPKRRFLPLSPLWHRQDGFSFFAAPAQSAPGAGVRWPGQPSQRGGGGVEVRGRAVLPPRARRQSAAVRAPGVPRDVRRHRGRPPGKTGESCIVCHSQSVR